MSINIHQIIFNLNFIIYPWNKKIYIFIYKSFLNSSLSLLKLCTLANLN